MYISCWRYCRSVFPCNRDTNERRTMRRNRIKKYAIHTRAFFWLCTWQANKRHVNMDAMASTRYSQLNTIDIDRFPCVYTRTTSCSIPNAYITQQTLLFNNSTRNDSHFHFMYTLCVCWEIDMRKRAYHMTDVHVYLIEEKNKKKHAHYKH